MNKRIPNNIRNILSILTIISLLLVILASIASIYLFKLSTDQSSIIIPVQEEQEDDLIAELDIGERIPGTTEEIELKANIEEAKYAVALIRLYVNGGKVKDFNSTLLALPVCSNGYLFEEDKICADVTDIDMLNPGQVLAIVTIEWDKDTEGSIWQERAGGYFIEGSEIALDIASLPLTGDQNLYGESTPDGNIVMTDELRMLLSTLSLLLMIGVTYISEKIVKAKNATKIFKAMIVINFLFIIYATALYIERHYFAPADTQAYATVDRDELVSPLRGSFVITNAYGFACYVCSGPGDNFHSGIDLGPRQTIYASGAGKVIHAGLVSGWTPLGNMVTIEHTASNGSKYYTRYAHLESIYVRVGDIVDSDTELGMMGSTGNSSGVHLHFEVRKATNTWYQSDFYDPTDAVRRENVDIEDEEDGEDEPVVSEEQEYLCGEKGCRKDSECENGSADYSCDESLDDWPNNNMCVKICPSGYVQNGPCDCLLGVSITTTPIPSINPTVTPNQLGMVCGPIDSNHDGILNYFDLSNLSAKYNKNCLDNYDDEDCGGLDSNHDNKIDYRDLYQFISRYYPRAMNCHKRELL